MDLFNQHLLPKNFNLIPRDVAVSSHPNQYLGSYKTLIICACDCVFKLLILVWTLPPVSLENGTRVGRFVVFIMIIGIGIVGIKSTVAPLIAD